MEKSEEFMLSITTGCKRITKGMHSELMCRLRSIPRLGVSARLASLAPSDLTTAPKIHHGSRRVRCRREYAPEGMRFAFYVNQVVRQRKLIFVIEVGLQVVPLEPYAGSKVIFQQGCHVIRSHRLWKGTFLL